MEKLVVNSVSLGTKKYVERCVRNILEKYKEKVGFFTVPMCEKTLCKVVEELNGITIAIEPDKRIACSDEGLLMPVRGGFVIKYGTLDKHQKRFPTVKIRETICHELGHILFYDCSSLIPQLKTKPSERLCHDIARQLLLPDEIVRERFVEKMKGNFDLVNIIKQLSREFEVARMLIVRRLTEDLSLLKDTMITFWKYKPEKGGRYRGYVYDAKSSPELRKLISEYWRKKIHIEAWDKVISKVIVREVNNLPEFLYVGGKRRNKGKIKSISFKIQYVCLYNRDNNLSFGWENNITPPSSILSIQKFDLEKLRE